MDQRLERELAAAVEAVRRASAVCRAVQRSLVGPQTLEKKDRSPVTVADFASQAVVCGYLSAVLPDVAVVGEESAGALRGDEHAAVREAVVRHASAAMDGADEAAVLAAIDRGLAEPDPAGRFWTLDPIDGTKGFLRGEQYAVALGLIEAGRPVLGVLGCPNLPVRLGAGDEPDAPGGVLLAGVIGGEAWQVALGGGGELGPREPIAVSAAADPSAARFCESVESGHSDQGLSAAIAAKLGITAPPVRMDSQAKYAAVARGDASIYLRLPTRPGYRECIWDHAAGAAVIEAAGGRVTDITGRPLDFARGRRLEANRGIVATGGPIHDAVLAAVGEAMAEAEASAT